MSFLKTLMKTIERIKQIAQVDGTSLEEAAAKLEKIEAARIAEREARNRNGLDKMLCKAAVKHRSTRNGE
jgi:hypothetical protein